MSARPGESPAYNIFGWQRPCYLLQDGYAESFKELMETTKWEEYGVASGNPKCANCMVSCGYEPTAVMDGFGSLKGFWAMVRGNFSLYKDDAALKLLSEPRPTAQQRWCRSPSRPRASKPQTHSRYSPVILSEACGVEDLLLVLCERVGNHEPNQLFMRRATHDR